MKTTLHHAVAPFAVLLSTAVLAQAHPGHDGHDFTWDFGHLAAYPDVVAWLKRCDAVPKWPERK